MVSLSKRLQMVADLAGTGRQLIDIGTDHGYVPLYLVESGRMQTALACDVRPGPLARAESHISLYGCQDRIITRLSDGLEQVSRQEAQSSVIVMAGMGGALIQQLIEAQLLTAMAADRLVLQPQSEWSQLRAFLKRIGFVIEAEDLLEEDGKWYLALAGQLSGDAAAEAETDPVAARYGQYLFTHHRQTLAAYLDKEAAALEQVLTRLPSTAGERRAEIAAQLSLNQAARKKLDISVLDWLEQRWPLRFQASWDNCGLLLGERKRPIRRVLVALDVTTAVTEEAIREEVDLILTHHPLIFSGIKQLTDALPNTAKILRLAAHGISSFAMHTNFDCIDMGQICSTALPLTKAEPLEVIGRDAAGRPFGYGLVGCLQQPLTVGRIAELLKRDYGLESLHLFGQADRLIERVAILPGSGRHSIEAAIAQGAQLFISGDIGHHEGLDSTEAGMTVLDAGHFGLEQRFIEYVSRELQEAFPELIVITTTEQGPMSLV
ncbi:MAG: Nif3-like dinuclear metal center hexameric protein [Lachnospiraceae bacterium]|nr:Nif3-like dinuclear metal center hexameric protein [Lachnospiraceae bacterium]MDY5742108.1 Nif3-like dinuclear metal center hexameric protein [Lachnospiraceae bacterium]